jgi:hypothetical protein
LLLLLIIIYQDFKNRTIWWGLIPLLTVVIAIIGFHTINHYLWRIWLVNGLFFSLQLLVLTIYFSVKNKQLINITNKQLGLGDILFFIPLSGFFSLSKLIPFLIIILLGSIIAVLILPKHRQNIPLAGVIAVGLIVVLILEWLNMIGINRYF